MLKPSRLCEKYLSTCVVGIDAHGHTHRRCSREYRDEDIDFPNKLFHVCSENKCNTAVFPPNRLQCYRCDGEESCDFMPSNSTTNDDVNANPKIMACSILSKLDQCYAYLAEDNRIYRGCLTDTTDHRLLCEQYHPGHKGICVKCAGSGCNNMPRVRPPLLSCIQCQKSHECAFGQDKSNATACKSQIQFGKKESCYTHFGFGESQLLPTMSNLIKFYLNYFFKIT